MTYLFKSNWHMPNFISKKSVKRQTWKTLNIISTLAIVLNTGMVGVLVQPKAASAASIGSYDQCSNNLGTGYTSGDTGCRWTFGNLQSNNSRYSEGEATVQRVWLTGFAPGSTHTVTLQYGTTKGGKHAYDFLTTWNASESWIVEADQCQSITGCSTSDASENTFAIPHDPNGSGQFETGTRNFTMRGGTLTGATAPAIVSGSYAGDSETATTVSFTVAPSGDMCASGTCSVALWFGAHIAKSADWQPFNGTTGASTISGSPYHVALAAMDGESIGQRDNQMQSATVVGQCLLTIVKSQENITHPNGPTAPGDLLLYTLNFQNAGTADCTGGGVRVDDTIPTNTTYASWHDQSNATFGYVTNPDKFGADNAGFNGSLLSWNASTLTPNESGWVKFKVTVNQLPTCSEVDITNVGKIYADQLQNGTTTDGWEHVTSNEVSTHVSTPCEGGIKVNKKVDANGDGTFEGGNTEANALGFDWGLDAGTVNRDMGSTATGLTVGTHDVTENSVANYHFVGWYPTGNTDFTCASPKGTTLPITLSVAAGTTTEITLCNARDTGRISFDKVVVGGDAKDSDFTFTVNGHDYKDGDAASFPTGSYSLTEGAVTGYTLTGASGACSLGQNGVTLTVTGQGGTCTITNTRDLGRLLVKKNVLNPDGSEVADTHEFTVTLDGVNPKTIAEGTSAQYPGLATGTYTVAENADGNYILDGYDIDTDVNTPGAQITITKGQTTVLTVTNKQKKATITISKDVRDFQGNDVIEVGNFSVTSNAGDFTIAEGDPEVLSVNPGTYTFTEGDSTNYTIHSTNPKEITVGSNGSSVYKFVNWQKPSSITVCKYVDVNGDHSVKNDPLYTAEGGWTMWLDDEVSQQTVNGCTTFNNLTSGTYDISEGKKDGWEKTTPDTNFVSVTVGANDNSQTVNFGNFQLGKIWGYKYEAGTDNKLADWEICLNGDEECTTTNADGYYEFTGLSAGDYTVAETLQGGWWAITPSLLGYNVPVVSGSNEQRDFTNFHGVSISGSKFNDLDGNGSWNNEEPSLGGWTIELYKDGEGFELVATTVTDGAGNYSFTNLGPGTYRVREVQQGGWTQTTGSPSDITVVSGQNISNTDFGNFQYGRISGYKFNDLDGDGYWDEGEPVLNGWSICLNGTENCVVTGSGEWADGYYEFTGLSAATYDVYEQGQAGWTQTLPGDEYEVVVTSGTGYGEYQSYDFGNYKYGRISGYKYDWNTENKLDGWTICLEKQTENLRSVSLDVSQNCVVTGAGEWPIGYYEFTGLNAGTYKVYEINQYGWEQMEPNDPRYHTVLVTSGTGYGQYQQYDFWNRKNVFDVTIEKSADLEVVQAGSNITYTLNWTLTGNTSAEVKLFDVLPANTTFVSADNGGFLDGDTVRWNLGTYSPVTNFSVHLTVKVNSPLDKGTVISNTGNVCGLGAIADGEPFLSDSEDRRRQKCDDDTTTTTVDSKPILGIEKTANVATVGGNQDVTYTITWSVAGNSKATNVVVNDPIPANTSFVSMGCGTTTGTCTTSTTGTPVTSTTWNLGTRNPGEGGTLTLVVKTAISVPNGSVIPNIADIRSAEVDPIFDEADVRAATAPALQITKTSSATIVNPGDPISYTVKVKNVGTDTAVNAVATDTLPAGFSFVSTSPVANSIVGQTASWNLGNMIVGQEVTLTYTVNVAPGTTAGVYDNIAKAKADNAPEVSTKVPVTTRVPQVLGETTSPVLEISKSVNKQTVAPGAIVTYTVKVKNSGTGSAINVVLQDILPIGFAFDATNSTSNVWNLGDIAVGETKTVTYNVKVGASVPNGSYENLAMASADNHGKVTATVPVQVKRGRVLAEVVETGAGIIDFAIATTGFGLIVLGFVLTRRKNGNVTA